MSDTLALYLLRDEIRQIINNEGIYETPSDEALNRIIRIIDKKYRKPPESEETEGLGE